jgi:hypothetical protein
MSYYRYITGVYKSYWPQLNRTLRSSSVPRSTPDLDLGRYTRATTVAPSSFYSNTFFSHEATPFRDRAMSVQPSSYSYSYSTRTPSYSNFDYKVMDYMGQLERDDHVRNTVSSSRRSYTSNYTTNTSSTSSSSSTYRDGDYRTGFAHKYNYYDGNKHLPDYLYNSTSDLLGSWRHYNLSGSTLTERNQRAKSPLQTRELDRYYGTKKRVDYIGDISSGSAKDFRYYSYRRVPYFGGSDNYSYMKHRPTGGRRL